LITYLVVWATVVPVFVWGAAQLNFELERRMILILWVRVGLRVTLIARRLTVSMVMFQKPVLGAVILAGNVSNAPPW
jgi:hypothetical protein